MPAASRVLVKLRPSAALGVAERRANLRPLHDAESVSAAFGLAGAPEWFVADIADGADIPWDAAHARVADQLGIAESDVVFAEPDLAHEIYKDPNQIDGPFALGADCAAEKQTSDGGRAVGPGIAWHLDGDHSQLGLARDSVQFGASPTRIGHIDTGYDRKHASKPRNINTQLERNFVRSDGTPNDAQDPDNDVFLIDNSGHGTGTIGVLAGSNAPDLGDIVIGGAPDAEIVPLRIADRVTLFYTSAFAKALKYAVSAGCDVVTISMGGLPSSAWNDAVNQAYEAGVCIVAAAGNNVNRLPTRHIVYPARYRRVIAVCGVMADGRPYANLTGKTTLEGNFGPDSRMTSALATYTPNIPWPKFGCERAIRLNGEGTSAATPQVAAAAALWYEKNKSLRRDWQRVEAVRKALFDSAKDRKTDPSRFGHGILQASAALAIAPVLGLPKTEPDNDSFAFLRILTGLGISEIPPRELMFNLELTQRWLMNEELQRIVPDPDVTATLDAATMKKFMEAVIEDDRASRALRNHVTGRYPVLAGSQAHVPKKKGAATEAVAVSQTAIAVSDPPFRRLRVYAVDPSFSTRLDTASINEAVLKVKWETLKPGPVGEYLQVTDDNAAGKVNLNDPRLLARDGWAPSEGNPAFRQQMVYAVAMKTIAHFEQALGRPVLWRAAMVPNKPADDSEFVQHLEIRPHALHQANAYYSAQEMAILFGYFEASSLSGGNVPGSRVYTALSHDIIAHEMTHAILDGMHRRFSEPSNPDVLALHEAFADIVALMQHFSLPEVLANEIARTRGNIETESMLGSLAIQFGYASSGRGALRDAIGAVDAEGKWVRLRPNPAELDRRLTPHARGAILVAAVFDAFIAIYRARTADLLRIYTGGTGVVPSGAIHPDLVARLSAEAATSARHVLNMCIRALDYIPPVDITFGEYLRGIITADVDLVGDDRYNYRVAFVEAFRARGIYPRDLETLSVDTLRWQGIDLSHLKKSERAAVEREYVDIVLGLRGYAEACVYLKDREVLFHKTREHRAKLAVALKAAFKKTPQFAAELGLDVSTNSFEVHALRRSLRIGPDGLDVPQVMVALTQSRKFKIDERLHTFRGGSTLIIDLSEPAVKYRIVKRINSSSRLDRTRAFLEEASKDPLRALLIAPDRPEPFALLHLLADTGI